MEENAEFRIRPTRTASVVKYSLLGMHENVDNQVRATPNSQNNPRKSRCCGKCKKTMSTNCHFTEDRSATISKEEILKYVTKEEKTDHQPDTSKKTKHSSGSEKSIRHGVSYKIFCNPGRSERRRKRKGKRRGVTSPTIYCSKKVFVVKRTGARKKKYKGLTLDSIKEEDESIEIGGNIAAPKHLQRGVPDESQAFWVISLVSNVFAIIFFFLLEKIFGTNSRPTVTGSRPRVTRHHIRKMTENPEFHANCVEMEQYFSRMILED